MDFLENNMSLSNTPQLSLLLSYRDMNEFEKWNSFHHAYLSYKDNLCNVTNTNAYVSFVEYSDSSKQNMLSIHTLQTSLLSWYCHINTFEKRDYNNDSDISEKDDLCNVKNMSS